ncbi:MAG: hypothetical protein DI532_12225 [Azospirillum brasilense]|nr:MAG: hypothetical protein DI532_12225 [Azospirillum brasilense]
MPGRGWRRCRRAAAVLACLPALLAPPGPAAADVAWTERVGAWSVSLYRGERGDAWCGWTTMWSDAASGLGRSVSLQMRGGEAVLFLFFDGGGTSGLTQGSQLALEIDGTSAVVKADFVRWLPNGFLMARGVLAGDAAARGRLVAMVSGASSLRLALPDGSAWTLEPSGLAQTAAALDRCMGALEPGGPPG